MQCKGQNGREAREVWRTEMAPIAEGSLLVEEER